MREIELSNGEQVRVYDASGPYTEVDARIDLSKGLAPIRDAWLSKREGLETYAVLRSLEALDRAARNGQSQPHPTCRGLASWLDAQYEPFAAHSHFGLVMAEGLVAKTSILLIDYTNTLREEGMGRVEALAEAARTRLRPILMTSATMVFGMAPLAVGEEGLGVFAQLAGVIQIALDLHGALVEVVDRHLGDLLVGQHHENDEGDGNPKGRILQHYARSSVTWVIAWAITP